MQCISTRASFHRQLYISLLKMPSFLQNRTFKCRTVYESLQRTTSSNHSNIRSISPIIDVVKFTETVGFLVKRGSSVR